MGQIDYLSDGSFNVPDVDTAWIGEGGGGSTAVVEPPRARPVVDVGGYIDDGSFRPGHIAPRMPVVAAPAAAGEFGFLDAGSFSPGHMYTEPVRHDSSNPECCGGCVDGGGCSVSATGSTAVPLTDEYTRFTPFQFASGDTPSQRWVTGARGGPGRGGPLYLPACCCVTGIEAVKGWHPDDERMWMLHTVGRKGRRTPFTIRTQMHMRTEPGYACVYDWLEFFDDSTVRPNWMSDDAVDNEWHRHPEHDFEFAEAQVSGAFSPGGAFGFQDFPANSSSGGGGKVLYIFFRVESGCWNSICVDCCAFMFVRYPAKGMDYLAKPPLVLIKYRCGPGGSCTLPDMSRGGNYAWSFWPHTDRAEFRGE